jgi:hypothetical protein
MPIIERAKRSLLFLAHTKGENEMSVFNSLMQSTASFSKTLIDGIRTNSPTIKTIIGMVGAGATAVETGRATWKTKDILDNLPEDTDSLDKAKLIGPLWIKPAMLLGLTETCIFSANKENAARIATLAAGYAASEARNKDQEQYISKAKEMLGEKKDAEIKKEVYSEQVAANPPIDGVNIVDTGNGKTLFQEKSFTGRYFYSSMDAIERTFNKINLDIIDDENPHEYSVADVLYELGVFKKGEKMPDYTNMNGYSKDKTGKVAWESISIGYIPDGCEHEIYVTGIDLDNYALYYEDGHPGAYSYNTWETY